MSLSQRHNLLDIGREKFLHNDLGCKLNDELVPYFKVLYSTLTLRTESTQKFYIIFDFGAYCDSVRKSITINFEGVQYFAVKMFLMLYVSICK